MNKNNIKNLKNHMQYLFSDEEMFPRKNAKRDEVVSTFETIGTDIVNAMLAAGDDYLQLADKNPIARREHNFATTILHGLMIEKLSKISEVTLDNMTNSSSSTILRIGSYLVWLKKLDKDGKPKINNTQTSTKRIYQKAEGEDTQPMLILGYKLDDLQRINHISISYMEGDKHLWAPIDIGDNAASSLVISHSPSSEELDVKVRPKIKKKIEVV